MDKERPILMNAEMVRAILVGPKTQTRRPIQPQPVRPNYIQPMWGRSPDGHEYGEKWLWREVGPDYPDNSEDDRRCPFGVPGDRLWVRETFYTFDGPGSFSSYKTGRVYYRADGLKTFKWKPAIHMPRWASRITLEITDVRVQRVQEISEEDAVAEGSASVEEFGRRWQSIYGNWSENPWVWALTFKRIKP